MASNFADLSTQTNISLVIPLFNEEESLAERGLTQDDLMDLVWEDEDEDYAEKPSIIMVNREQMADVMAVQEVTLSF